MASKNATNALAPLFQSETSEPKSSEFPSFTQWLTQVSPELTWDHPHLKYVRSQLADVTLGHCKKLAISWPPQHYKTFSTTVRYPLWRMLRTPGLRVGVASYNQRYANKISRWTRRIVERLGLEYGDTASVDSWSLANGSTYIARGAGTGLSGEPVDLMAIDDPFRKREDADSEVIQEKVWEWYMDDVTPRVQQGGAIIIIHTRFTPGDLIGRLLVSEDAKNWRFVRLPAIAETQEERDKVHSRQGLPIGVPDPLGRQPGEPLCPAAFTIESLEDKKRVLQVGFETLYQQNDITRGGTFFEREWFGSPVDKVPENPPLKRAKRIRYWDLASSRLDSACYTAGILMARVGDAYYVEDVIRGRWNPAERNDVMLQTAVSDKTRPGFERTWFESPVFDKGGAAKRGIIAKLAGHAVRGDEVGGSGSKEVRAEPLADAVKGGLVKLVAGAWNSAYLSEMESFPKGTYKDQVDSSSGGFNRLTQPGVVVVTRDGVAG